MALIQHGSVSGTCALRLSFSSSAPPPSSPPPRVSLNFLPEKKGWRRSCFRRLICRAMVQESLQGILSVYARDMERLSAKKSLILAGSCLITLACMDLILIYPPYLITLACIYIASVYKENDIRTWFEELSVDINIMIDDQDLGFIVNFLGIFIFPLVIAYHYVAADPKYEAT